MSYRSFTVGRAVIVSSTSLPWRAALWWRQGKKCEQDFTNLAYGWATAEAGSGSAATNYREEHNSEHNETPVHLGTLHTRLGLLEVHFENCLCSRMNLLEMRSITGRDGNGFCCINTTEIIPIVPPGGNPMVCILLQSCSPFTGLRSYKMVKTEHEELQRFHCHHGIPGYRSVLACLMCPLTQGWALPGSTEAAGEAPAQGRTCASRGDASDRARAVTQKVIQKSQTTLAVWLILYRHQEKGLCLTCPQ